MNGLSFAVSLEDHISPNANQAASALKKLENELTTSKTKLSQYQQQLSKANQVGDIEGHRKYTALVEEARRQTYGLQESILSLGNVAQNSTGSLSGLASSLGPYGAAVGAAIAITVGFGVALGELVKKGVETALEVNAVNERLSATFEALGDKPGQGQKTLDFLNKLSHQLPQSRAELAKWTQQFEAFGITDLGELRQQIKATASAEAIAGDTGAEAYRKLAEKIQDAVQGHHKLKMGRDVLKDIALAGANAATVAAKLGMNLKDFDAALKGGTIDAQAFGNALSSTLIAKGKKPLEAMGSEIGTVWAKVKETFNHLFDGIDTSPITDALKVISYIGDQGQASGKAMHDGMKSGIQGVINWLGKMLTEGEVVFLTLELYVVRHQKQLTTLGHGFELVGKGIMFAAKELENLLNIASGNPPAWLMQLLGKGGGGWGDNASGGAGKTTEGGSGAGGAGGRAPAHAAGGMVHRPAHGEFFASVAPGEMILPQRQAREIMGGGFSAGAREMFRAQAAPANGNGGGHSVHIDHITVQAAGGVTDAQSLTVTGLTLALERLQLASGR